jgi:IrrE N-terminal-like domain
LLDPMGPKPLTARRGRGRMKTSFRVIVRAAAGFAGLIAIWLVTSSAYEDEANRFAGAFLLPRAAFTRDMMGVKPKEWAYLFEMKRHWGASVKAILYRAYELGLIDAADYRTRMGYYSFRKWNSGEPEEPARDQPGLFSSMLAKYCEDYGKSIADISKDLGWTVGLFGKITGVRTREKTPSSVLSLADYRDRGLSSAADDTIPKVM